MSDSPEAIHLRRAVTQVVEAAREEDRVEDLAKGLRDRLEASPRWSAR